MRRRRLRWRALFFLVVLGMAAVAVAPTVWRVLYPFPYRSVIDQAAAVQNLDPRLVAAVIRTESHFRPAAVSAKGAIGLMQIMPATGAWIAGQLGQKHFNPSSLYNPTVNIQLGTWYLNNLAHEFHGDLFLVLAAYNGGRNNVNKWLAEDLFKGTPNVSGIPFKETRDFVIRVTQAYSTYRYLYPQKSHG